MRLTTNNIMFVKVQTWNGTPYSYFVRMDSENLSDSRTFHNVDRYMRSTVEYYPEEDLPKAVRQFMAAATKEEFQKLQYDDETEVITYIYRR